MTTDFEADGLLEGLEGQARTARLDLSSWRDGTFDRDPGIVPFSAGPVRCGAVRALEDAGMAEVEAALNLGEPLTALDETHAFLLAAGFRALG